MHRGGGGGGGGGCSVHRGDIMNHEYIGGCSVQWEDIMIHVGSKLIKAFDLYWKPLCTHDISQMYS